MCVSLKDIKDMKLWRMLTPREVPLHLQEMANCIMEKALVD